MKRPLFLVLLLVGASLACSLGRAQPQPPTPTPPPPAEGVGVELDPVPVLPTDTPAPPPTPTPLPGTRIVSGDQALNLGDYESALPAYQDAWRLSTDPEILSAALVGMGRVYYQSRDYQNALRVLRSLVESYPDSPHRAEGFFYLGRTYQVLNRYNDAADAYIQYLSLRPGLIDAYVHELAGDALYAGAEYASALGEYQAAVNSPHLSTGLDLEVKLAHTYALSGDPNTALVMYDDIYQRSDSDYTRATIDLLKGRLLASLGQTDGAYTALLDAVQNFPRAYDSYQALVDLVNAGYPVDELQRGVVDYYAEQYGVALAAFDRYLDAGPADPAQAYYYKGLTLRAMTDSAGAVGQWDAVIGSYSDSPFWDEAWEQKAYTQWAYLDLYPEAVQTLLDFVASAPGHSRAAEFLFDAAQVAERSGDLAKASALWQRVTAEYPVSGYAYRALFLAGIAEYRRGDFSSAQAVFLRAQTIGGDAQERSAALMWIGKTYQALGDNPTAVTIWQQAAAVDPTGYYSERARDLILNRAPFSPPEMFDVGFDLRAERAEAEAWMRTRFALPEGTDLSGPGELANDPRLQRGQEFLRLGLYPEANAEFDSLRMTVQPDPAACYRLANALLDLGLYRPAILAARQVLTLAGMDDAATLTAPVFFNHIRFGPYFAGLVIPNASQYNFHPLLIWSLIRQESFFDPSIRSSAGARGLMQITLPTGQDIADRLGWPPNYDPEDLYRPEVSVRMGLSYLSDQVGYLGGNLYAALAAYNSGPGNAALWKELAPDDLDLYLEVIRLDEPRRYIQGIYEMYNIYRRLYERTP